MKKKCIINNLTKLILITNLMYLSKKHSSAVVTVSVEISQDVVAGHSELSAGGVQDAPGPRLS